MSGNNQSASQIKFLWVGLVASSVSIWFILVLMDELFLVEPIEFKYADYIFLAEIVLIPASAYLIRFSKEANRKNI